MIPGSDPTSYYEDQDCGLAKYGGGYHQDIDCGMPVYGDIHTDSDCGMNNGSGGVYPDSYV
jgi:hypothetical protein